MTGATILVADDDRSMRIVLGRALGRLGHNVRSTRRIGLAHALRIEYDAENSERKSVMHGTPGTTGFVSFPIRDAVGLGNIQVEMSD